MHCGCGDAVLPLDALYGPHPRYSGVITGTEGMVVPHTPNHGTTRGGLALAGSVPPDPDVPWSDRDTDSEGEMGVMGEDDPKPTYAAKDIITVYTSGRHDIVARWAKRGQRGTSATPCPVPWDVCDLGHVRPPARPESEYDNWKFSVVRGILQLEYYGLIIHVRNVSDLAVSTWAFERKREWPGRVSTAQGMYSCFAELVNSRNVHLYEGGRGRPHCSPVVYFDVPFPAVGRRRTSCYTSRPVAVTEAWRSLTKSFIDMNSPVHLEESFFAPSWWPSVAYHGRRQTVNAFHDGWHPPDYDDLAGGSDAAVLVARLDSNLAIFAYLTDLMDERNVAMWVDLAQVEELEKVKRKSHYVIGSDGASCFVDRSMCDMLSGLSEERTVEVAGTPRIRYPKLNVCRYISMAFENLTIKTYGRLAGSACGGVDAVMRAMALSPFHLNISCEGNCFFRLFRQCQDTGGRCFGPVSAGQIRDCGLFDSRYLHARVATTGQWVAAEGDHLAVAESPCLATPRHQMKGCYGKKVFDVVGFNE